jgi:SAM-dependent methyltransferase
MTQPQSIDYDRVADLYDNYVRVGSDVPFFLNAARQAAGDVLELMSGTGRVSLPLIEAGVRLTCVDRSAEMLAVLFRKLEQRQLAAEVYQMDVRELSLPKQYSLALIPFHSLAELVSPQDRHRTLTRIYEHLEPGGHLICTLHNPTVRSQSVDGQLHLIGTHTRADQSGTLVAWIVEARRPLTAIVDGCEFFEEYDADGLLRSKRLMEIHYALISREEFEGMIEPIGFRVVSLHGDYAGSDWHEASPFMIWKLQKSDKMTS